MQESWQERAARGERRARELGVGALPPGGLDAPLLALLADADNTSVTFRTALALLRRGDALGLRHVLHALATANETGDESTGDWLVDAFLQVLCDDPVRYADTVRPLLVAAASGSDAREAGAAEEVLADLGPGGWLARAAPHNAASPPIPPRHQR